MINSFLKHSHTLQWTQELRMHPLWKSYRFKKLNIGCPPYSFPPDLLMEVEEDQFRKQEEFVIPLFTGSQFGICPLMEVFEDFEEPILIARLNKSLLSGCVAGLSIGIWFNGEFKEIEFFKN